jgi:hypothetical protein
LEKKVGSKKFPKPSSHQGTPRKYQFYPYWKTFALNKPLFLPMVQNKAQVIEAEQWYMQEIPFGRQIFLNVVEVQNYKIEKELKID